MAEESKFAINPSGDEPDSPEAPNPAADVAYIDSPHHILPFLTVGLGGSAGGTEAFIDLFNNLACDTGMAFVLVSHLAPDVKSHLVEILKVHTRMPVALVEHHTRPEPNHVYVLPPKTVVTISHGLLSLEPRPEGKRAPMPIDHFFHSLASDQKAHAIGVVLSGMDSDGALGMRAIKGEGGITIVQDPDSARFPSMPRSSIAADHIDLVVPPTQIAAELERLGRQFSNPELRLLHEGQTADGEEADLDRMFRLLRGISHVDFKGYRRETIRRRTARRMLLKRIDHLSEYVSHLQTHQDELRLLHEDLLIGVTRFFRDPEVFEALKKEILPQMFAARTLGEQIRIWVAGCSTGEEVYSIAICLLEYLNSKSLEEPLIQIFGTDASESSIVRARAGIYPETVAAEISPERLRRFFVRNDKGYQVSKRLRDLCIFARQNLCTDPPFSKLDLVCCRNVLIYFNQRLYKQIVPIFHYALRPDGYLLLGVSEALRDFHEMFTLIDRKHKVFSKVSGSTRAVLELPRRLQIAESQPELPEATGEPPGWAEMDLQRAVDRIVLARYGPPGVVVNEALEIIYARGHTAPYFELAPGPPNFQLLRMIHESIATSVRDAVHRAIAQNIPVQVDNLHIRDEDRIKDLMLEVLPLQNFGRGPRCFLLLFLSKEQGNEPMHSIAGRREAREIPPEHRDQLVGQLQQDLKSTKLYLQSLIEDRDAKNQELISANEEIQSQNEELQSTNEELETTKEEVQSANEELQTVNEELQQRNSALTQTGNDLANLLTNVNLPVLMLNNDLQIRQFTGPAQRILSVRSSDIGRPLSEIRTQLSVENLGPIVQEVLETLSTKELEVQDREQHWYLLRVRPYRTSENKIEGAVLVWIDIDQVRRSQQEVREARDFAWAVIEGVPLPLVVLNLDLKIRTANSAFRNLAQKAAGELERRSFPELATSLWNMNSVRLYLEKLREQEAGARFEMEQEISDPARQVLGVRGLALQADGDRVLLLTLEDITLRKVAEQQLTQERNTLQDQVETTERELGRTQEELRALAGKLITSQEEERRRVARELHDDVTQKLALLEMNIHQLELNVPANEMRGRIETLRQQTAVLTEDVRQMSHRLHPAILEDLGLSIALQALTDEFAEREEMPATFRRGDVPELVPREVAASFYRIAQEALRNVAKHAGKTHLKISLDKTQKGLRMEVTDSGRGFDPNEVNGGLGLISMIERARLVNGVVSIRSVLGRGTTIAVDAPVPPDDGVTAP